MSSHPQHTTGWRLLPWQHLASTMIPAAVLIVGLLLEPGPPAADTLSSEQTLDEALALADQQGLWVVQSRQGFVLIWRDPEGPTWTEQVPCEATCEHPDDWDLAGLARGLRHAKRAHPNADTLTLAPAEDVPFRAVTDTIEAARFHGDKALFPYAVVSRR